MTPSLLFVRGIDILLVIAAISMAICFWRLYRGPDTPNRTVAFDLISVHAVAILVLASVRYDETLLLDIALITAVLGFLGTMMFAHYVEASAWSGEEDEQ